MPQHFCVYHPSNAAISFCHHCHDWICSRCASEGREYYYCRKFECQEALQREGKYGSSTPPAHDGPDGRPSVNPSEPIPGDDLVTVASYPSSFTANLAKGLLESEGIEVYLAGDTLGSEDKDPFAGVRVQTKLSEADRALKILREIDGGFCP